MNKKSVLPPSCPFASNQYKCGQSSYWNELSCNCHALIACTIACPIDQELNPLSGCQCVNKVELRAKLYPTWATDYDIQKAAKTGYDNYSQWLNNSQNTTQCTYTGTCGPNFYWNTLACKCFSKALCADKCKNYPMPTEHCGCTDDKNTYYALFPKSATESDIQKSMTSNFAWPTTACPATSSSTSASSVQPGTTGGTQSIQPSFVTRPNYWPKCQKVDDCKAKN